MRFVRAGIAASVITMTLGATLADAGDAVARSPRRAAIPNGSAAPPPRSRLIVADGTTPVRCGQQTARVIACDRCAYSWRIEGGRIDGDLFGETVHFTPETRFVALTVSVATGAGSTFTLSARQRTSCVSVGVNTGDTYYVDVHNGSDLNAGTAAYPFFSVSKAVSVANDGDTIHVRGGEYSTGETFPIVVPSGVQLLGAGAESTVLDASGAATYVLACNGNSATTVVSGFTITGGSNVAYSGDAFGGGIVATNGDQTTISDNVIAGNSAVGYEETFYFGVGGNAYGGGIYLSGSSTRILNNVIHHNTAQGGGACCGTDEDPMYAGSGYGGGIYVVDDLGVEIINNTLVGNAAVGGSGDVGGSGLYGGAYGEPTVVFANNIFADNQAAGGTGYFGAGSGSVGGLEASGCSNCLFYANSPGGGTIGTNPVLADPQFVDPLEPDYHIAPTSPAVGAGAYSASWPQADLDGASRPNPPSIGAFEPEKTYYVNVTTGSNSNPGNSAAAPFKTITRALSVAAGRTVIHVAAGSYVVAAGESFPMAVPSGTRLLGAGPETTIIDASGANTRVMELNGNSSATMVGGFTITGGRVHDWFAYGGGIYSTGADRTTVSGNFITGNVVLGYDGVAHAADGGPASGGGIYVDGDAQPAIINNVISNNGAYGGIGEDEYENPDDPNDHNLFAGYGGAADGGGIAIASGLPVMVANNTFFGNVAAGGDGGWGYYTTSDGGDGAGGGASGPSTASFVNNIFVNNSATAGYGPAGSDGVADAGGLGAADGASCLFHSNSPNDGMTGTNAVLADPQFADAANGDFHIWPNSPAAGAGTSVGAPTHDLDGLLRPSPPSIGAYEPLMAQTTTTLTSSPNPSTQGVSATLTAAVTSPAGGGITGTVTFKDGSTSLGSASLDGLGNATLSTSALAVGTRSLTAVYSGDSNFEGSTSAVHLHTVNAAVLTAPQSFVATGLSASQIHVSWQAVAGATGYQIWRRSAGLAFALVHTTTATSHAFTTGLSVDTIYLFSVRAIRNAENGPFSAADVATTLTFTDDPLVAGSTPVKAVHLMQLRNAVNALRALGGLSGYPFTDPSLASGMVARAAHLTDLRNALDEGRLACGLPALGYTDGTVVAKSTRIKRPHLVELRNGVK